DPDVVVHAGDLFHVVRPSNGTIVWAYRAINELQQKRKGKPFVLIGGNHDTPRTADSGNILTLFADIPGVVLATRAARSFDFPKLDLEVLWVPSHSLRQREQQEFEPTIGRKHGLLTIHGMEAAALPYNYHPDFDFSETQSDRWTYVALGDYHGF